jgi:uncharacterized protein
MVPGSPPRVIATEAALQAIEALQGEQGSIILFQSGGCCDGSLPMCFAEGQMVVGSHDVLLGRPGGCPFYIDGRQFEVVKHTQLILDVAPGRPEGFSLASGKDTHFVIRSRVFSDAEKSALTTSDGRTP